MKEINGVFIPRQVWENKNLSLIEKCLIAEIIRLDSGQGCYQTNEYFAEYLSLSVIYVRKIISTLTDKKILIHSKFNGRARGLLYKDSAICEMPKIDNDGDNIVSSRQILEYHADRYNSIMQGDTIVSGRVIKNNHADWLEITTNGEDRTPQLLKNKKVKKSKKVVNENEELFNTWWNLYPKKKAKEAAKKVFYKLSEVDQEALVKNFDKYKINFSKEVQFIPFPTTFINQRRWEDEVDEKPKLDFSSMFSAFESETGDVYFDFVKHIEQIPIFTHKVLQGNLESHRNNLIKCITRLAESGDIENTSEEKNFWFFLKFNGLDKKTNTKVYKDDPDLATKYRTPDLKNYPFRKK